MPGLIAILDDEPDRIAAMKPLLSEHAARFDFCVFDNAPDMNVWLAENLDDCVLLCLDHDLGPNRRREGEVLDPGIGRDVVDFLATRNPVCPVIIHTTNIDARPGMLQTLQSAGWAVTYVSPYEDDLWIREVWITEVVLALQGKP